MEDKTEGDRGEKLTTQTQVAKALGISRQAVSRLIKRREKTGIPVHQSAWGMWFYRDEVVEWYKTFTPGRGPLAGTKLTDTQP